VVAVPNPVTSLLQFQGVDLMLTSLSDLYLRSLLDKVK